MLLRLKIGQAYEDDSHPEEPVFTIVSIVADEHERIAELDNGQWYELDGPEGLVNKIAAGTIRPLPWPSSGTYELAPEQQDDPLRKLRRVTDEGA